MDITCNIVSSYVMSLICCLETFAQTSVRLRPCSVESLSTKVQTCSQSAGSCPKNIPLNLRLIPTSRSICAGPVRWVGLENRHAVWLACAQADLCTCDVGYDSSKFGPHEIVHRQRHDQHSEGCTFVGDSVWDQPGPCKIRR